MYFSFGDGRTINVTKLAAAVLIQRSMEYFHARDTRSLENTEFWRSITNVAEDTA